MKNETLPLYPSEQATSLETAVAMRREAILQRICTGEGTGVPSLMDRLRASELTVHQAARLYDHYADWQPTR